MPDIIFYWTTVNENVSFKMIISSPDLLELIERKNDKTYILVR